MKSMHPEHEKETVEKWLKESQKGYTRIVLLILLNEKPFHGYEMMKEVEDRTEGFWKPTAGGVYPILQSLEKSGYIKGEWSPEKRKRKIYKLTESGKLVLDRALMKHSQIADSMNSLFEEYAKAVLHLDPKTVGVPRVPNPFLSFLEKKAKNKLEALEMKRKRIQHMVEMLQDQLKATDDRLVELRKKEKQSSSG